MIPCVDHRDDGDSLCAQCLRGGGSGGGGGLSAGAGAHPRAGVDDNGDGEGGGDGGLWAAVVACYAALKYATHTGPAGATEEVLGRYRGEPFACRLRLLPLRRAVQFLLLACRLGAGEGPGAAADARGAPGDAPGVVLGEMLLMLDVACPELTQVREQLHCYRLPPGPPPPPPAPRGGPTGDPSADPPDPAAALMHLLHRTTTTATTMSGDTAQPLPALRAAVTAHAIPGPALRTLFLTATDRLLAGPAPGPDGPSPSLGHGGGEALWALFTALHETQPSPQEVELAAVNAALTVLHGSPRQCPPTITTSSGGSSSGGTSGSSGSSGSSDAPRPAGSARAGPALRLIPSYETLAEEPFLLFRLPRALSAFAEPYLLKLVLCVTRGALRAGRAAARVAWEDKRGVAAAFHAAGLPGRSLAEASLGLGHWEVRGCIVYITSEVLVYVMGGGAPTCLVLCLSLFFTLLARLI